MCYASGNRLTMSRVCASLCLAAVASALTSPSALPRRTTSPSALPRRATSPRALPRRTRLRAAGEAEGLDATLWTTIRAQASAASASPVLAPYLARCIASRGSLADAVAGVLADRVAGGGAEGLPRDELAACLRGALAASAPSLARDVAAVVDGDPAAPDALAVVLHFKGFLALAAHRAAHALWASGDRDVALLLQGRASALFGVDIHPAASVGAGTFIDHGTGVVVGEQASLGEGCYVLHGVTLGATGKVRDGRRHPAVGAGVTLGSGASVLGPITVGDGATVGANACVTKDVEAGATVVETGYLNNRVLAPRKKKAS